MTSSVALPRPVARSSSGPLGVPNRSWAALLLVSFVAAVAVALFFDELAFWAGLGIFLTMVVFGHLCLVAAKYVAFPGLIAFSACIQWIVAPLLSVKFPSSDFQYQMVIPFEEYFIYAVPATLALWLGLHWPARRVLRGPVVSLALNPLPRKVRHLFDGMILLGILLSTAWSLIPAGFRFLIVILASFRFLGALGWLLTRMPGWRLRVGVVLFHLALQSATQGIFYQLVQWAGYCALLVAFRQRWRWALAGTLLVALLGAGLIQDVKQEYRSALQTGEAQGQLGRLAKLGSLLLGRVTGEDERNEDESFGDILVRFNQGWIIARIIDRVPSVVPYAKGATLRDAAVYTVVPRALVPDKPEGASRSLFAKYTGIELSRWTSMGLTVTGELYANFGSVGGIAATFAYGTFVGLLYAWFASMARRSVFWWALLPLFLLPAIEPSWNIEDILNHIVKSGVVLAIVLLAVPRMRALFGLRRPA